MNEPPAGQPTSPPPRKKRLRGILIAATVTLAGILVLTHFTPALIVRFVVLPQLNQKVGGHLTVKDWSASWANGLDLQYLRLNDAAGNEILSASHGHSHLAFLPSLSGKFNLGVTSIEGLRFHADASTSFDTITQNLRTLPDLQADLTIPNATGTITLPQQSPLTVDSLTLHLTVKDVDQPLTNSLTLRYHIGDASPSTLSLNGTATLYQNHTFAPDKCSAKQTAKLDHVDLAALKPLLASVDLSGQATGEFALVIDGASQSIDGQLNIDSLLLAGPLLKGDTFRTPHVTLPLTASRTVASSGIARVTIKSEQIDTPDCRLSVNVDFIQQDLSSLLASRPVSQPGHLHTILAIRNLASIANQLPHLLNLASGVTVTAGTLANDTNLTWSADAVSVSAHTQFEAAGKNGPRDIAIAPLSLALDAAGKPTADGLPNLTRLALHLASPFLTLDGSATSLASLNFKGDLDLDQLLTQAGQFADLGPLRAAGAGHFALSTTGNVADRAAPIDANLALTLDNIRVTGLPGNKPPIAEPRLAFTAAARIDRTRATPVDQFRQIALTLTSRSGTLDAKGESLAALDVKGDLDLAQLTDQAAPFADLHGAKAAGHARFTASTRGDLTQPAAPIATHLTLDLDAFSLTGHPTLGNIDNTSLSLDAGATLDHSVEHMRDATVHFTVGEKSALIIALAATADVDLATASLPKFDITQLAIDLPRLQHDFGALLPPTGNVAVSKGNLSLTLAGSFTHNTLKLNQPLSLQLKDLAVGPAGLTPTLQHENLSLTAGVDLSLAHGIDTKLSNLSFTSSSDLLNLSADEPITLILLPNHPPAATGSVAIKSRLARLTRIVQSLAGLTPTDPFGPAATADSLVKLTRAADGSSSLDASANLAHLTIPPYLNDAAVHLATTGSTPADHASATFTATADTPVAKLAVTNGKLLLTHPLGFWNSLAAADLAIDCPNLAALPTLIDGPFTVPAGSLSLRANLARQGTTTTARLNDLHFSNLSIKSGAVPILEGNPSLAFTLAVDATDGSAQPIQSIRLSDLQGALGIATLDLAEPLLLRDLTMPQPTLTGGLRLRGPLASLTPLLKAFAPQLPDLAGDYTLDQTLSTAAGKLRLAGGLSVTNFAVRQNNQPLFDDLLLHLTNDVDLDLKQHAASATSVKLTTDSNVAGLELKGRLLDWTAARQLDAVHLDVDYDLPKLLAVVKSNLPADQQQQLKDLRLDGHPHSSFDIAGSLPAGADPLKVLTYTGSIAIPSADYQTYHLRDLLLPLILQNGTLRTVYLDGHAAPPATLNEGKLDLSELTVNLNATPPQFTLPRNKILLTDVKLDAPLATDLLGRLSPFFADTKEATGKLAITVVDCQNVDPAAFASASSPQRLELLVNIADLHLQSGFTQVMAQFCDPTTFDPIATLKDGHVVLERGLSTHDFTLTFPAGYMVGVKGSTRLKDQMLLPLTATISKKLLQAVKTADPNAAATLPNKIDIPFDGKSTSPQPRLDPLNQLIRDAVAHAATPPAATPAAK